MGFVCYYDLLFQYIGANTSGRKEFLKKQINITMLEEILNLIIILDESAWNSVT